MFQKSSLTALLMVVVNAAGSTSALSASPGSPRGADAYIEQKVTADDGVANASFGAATAVDGSTALVGATGGNGAVYVFTLQEGLWVQSGKLVADDGADGDQFGYSVTLVGDTAVVGAPFAATGDNGHQGALYVFRNMGGTFVQAQKLLASDGAADDQLGWSVAYDGTRIAGGAPGVTINGDFATGTVYVFDHDGSAWSQSAELNADDGIGSSDFGFAVAIRADRLLIAAANADVGDVVAEGAAYAFTHVQGVWTQVQKIVPDDDGGANFGYALAYDGTHALITSPFSTVGDTAFQGAVYTYIDDGATLTQTQKIVTENAQPFDALGIAVALDGDLAVIGAPFVNGSQGAGYLFQLAGTDGWVQALTFTASDAVAGEGAAFGYAAGISGDSLIFGQVLATIEGETGQGAAYFYDRPVADLVFSDGFDGP